MPVISDRTFFILDIPLSFHLSHSISHKNRGESLDCRDSDAQPPVNSHRLNESVSSYYIGIEKHLQTAVIPTSSLQRLDVTLLLHYIR